MDKIITFFSGLIFVVVIFSLGALQNSWLDSFMSKSINIIKNYITSDDTHTEKPQKVSWKTISSATRNYCYRFVYRRSLVCDF